METDPRDVLKQVFGRVLEDYAFLFSEDIEEDAPPSTPGPYLEAGMCFDGPCARVRPPNARHHSHQCGQWASGR